MKADRDRVVGLSNYGDSLRSSSHSLGLPRRRFHQRIGTCMPTQAYHRACSPFRKIGIQVVGTSTWSCLLYTSDAADEEDEEDIQLPQKPKHVAAFVRRINQQEHRKLEREIAKEMAAKAAAQKPKAKIPVICGSNAGTMSTCQRPGWLQARWYARFGMRVPMH